MFIAQDFSLLSFILAQCALLLLVGVSALGWGQTVTRRLFRASALPALSRSALEASAGLGVVTLMFMLAGATGNLRALPLALILGAGILLWLLQARTLWVAGRQCGHDTDRGRAAILSTLLIVAVLSYLSTPLTRALQVPIQWDELMYHLPMASAWAEAGSLIVVAQLRYPLFPFNMEALYAGAMIFGNAVTAHLIHALTGLLAAVLAFSVARLFMPLVLALLCAAMLIPSLEPAWSSADIDMGLMLYVFCAFVTLGLCVQQDKKSYIYLAAFFLGLALGTKYQAMFFVPAFALCCVLVERRWQALALAALITLATGSYWYVRAYLVSGDPIHPVGGAVFGYWLWNAGDIEVQFAQLQTVRSLPPWYLLPSGASLLFWRSSPPLIRACMAASLLSVAIWQAVSGYNRYLMPLYPMLALLSAYFVHRVILQINGYALAQRYWQRIGSTPRSIMIVILLLTIVLLSWEATLKRARHVIVEPVALEAYLNGLFPGRELLSQVDTSSISTLYQIGLEGELYYLDVPVVIGDHYGPARYRQTSELSDRPAALAAHLRALGADHLILDLLRYPNGFNADPEDADFIQHFELVRKTDRAVLYRIRDAGNIL